MLIGYVPVSTSEQDTTALVVALKTANGIFREKTSDGGGTGPNCIGFCTSSADDDVLVV